MTNELTQVFVYGMLLDSTWKDRHVGKAAFLDGYRLEFDGRLATVREEEGVTVPGALLSCSEWELRHHFDHIEGVPYLYTRRLVWPHWEGIGQGAAWVYIKTDLTADVPELPSDHYVNMIRAGYRAYGHDDVYLDEALERAERRYLLAVSA